MSTGLAIHARCDERAAIADRSEPGVDGAGIGITDGREPALIEPALLDVCEIKRAVRHDRAAKAAAILS